MRKRRERRKKKSDSGNSGLLLKNRKKIRKKRRERRENSQFRLFGGIKGGAGWYASRDRKIKSAKFVNIDIRS